MSFYERNKLVTLSSYLLILGYYLWRFRAIYQNGLNPIEVFTLWGTVIILTFIINIVGIILAQIFGSIIHVIRTGGEHPDYTEDERDRLIELRGARLAYMVYSLGVLISMIMFVYGQPAIMMFAMIALSGLVAEVVADMSRLVIYRRGF